MTTQQAAPQLLNPDDAYALVHQRVYAPVFFTKLAQDFGIRPANAEEAQEMLIMAGQLRAADDQDRLKQAAAGTSKLAAARAHLQQALRSEGFQTDASQDQLIEKAAMEVAYQPDVAHAVLSLQAAAALNAARA
jgi:hypothetical protein